MGVETGVFATLADFPIFAALDRAAITDLEAAVSRRTWPAGTTLFLRGDTGDHLLAVCKGQVRLSLASPQGREIVIKHAGPGEVLGEIALIDGLPRSADATAIQETTGLILRRDRFLAVAAQRPPVAMAAALHLASLLRNTNYQMESIALYDLQTRLVRFLLLALEQRYGSEVPDQAELKIGFGQSDLSAILGASRPKLNGALQALTTTGAIRRNGETLTCNPPLLRRMAEADEGGVG